MGSNLLLLLRNKRKNMLFLIVLLFLYPFLNVAGINLTYIVKKEQDGIHPSCIAEDLERYSAIGWIYPIPESPENLPVITTRFIPTIENDYNCKFQKTSLCTTRWALKNWKIDNRSPKTKDLITDTRWEDFPTIFISNTSQEFSYKLELDSAFKTGFSVRANGLVEIFICSGPNPYENSCHYFHIDFREIYYKVFQVLPKEMKEEYKNNHLEHYKAYSNILSQDEWRSLIVSSDGIGHIKLADANLNRTLIEHREMESLTPMYMFVRSANNSLWKIHQNEFLFTNSTQTSRLGPQLSFTSKDLCVSLLVSTCSNCEMTFFYKSGTTLKKVGPTKNGDWTEVKLKDENVEFDSVNIFVETKFVDDTQKIPGFWAIDDVRVCNENEVKITRLEFNKRSANLSDENISCQLVRKPSWKPKKLTYSNMRKFPDDVSISSKASSLLLNWKEEDPENQITYFISYQANSLNDTKCTKKAKDLNRLKSNGFVRTNINELILENLVPYTTYTVNISTALHPRDKLLLVSTQPTVELSLEELPSNVGIKPSQKSVNVSWDKVDCSKKFGDLFYQIDVGQKEIKVEDSGMDINQQRIDGLEPNKRYLFTLYTARSAQGHSTAYNLKFSTLPTVAPPVENLELYSIDKYSASLRYELTANREGVAQEVQISRCNSLSFKKCRSSISPVRPCTLWPGKYCAEVDYLIPYQAYLFKVAVKNHNTPSFGKEVSVDGFANDRVPGKPTNVAYKMVDCHIAFDYCSLNITWLHPYNQNGTITSFEIILNHTDHRKDPEDLKFVHGVYKVDNKTYYRDYTYQVKSLPYSTYYNLYLRSVNDAYKSDFLVTTVKTDSLGEHIDQSPKLIAKSESTLLFKIPYIDSRLQEYTLTVVVQDYNKSKSIQQEIAKNRRVSDNLCHSYGNTWVSQVIKVQTNESRNVIIGGTANEKLNPLTKYCLIFIITNQYKGSTHDVVYYERLQMPEAEVKPKENASSNSFNHLYMLLLLLLLVPAGFLLYRYLRKKNVLAKPAEVKENVYESLPYDECELTETQSDVKNPSFSNTELCFS
ncbi:unnamed protein product [Phaedon cochleariae]|uniref:Fibronectin type-III domain-containing protein n=1 Tax=Phaedon cochleariae TaxID=80249 RepID=A0A9N9S8B5_PHACE|nr:unnamed protein product [Phaedon cochleariae]